MSDRFQGQVAIVTGGASGIGRRTAERFAAEGARVLIADVNPEGESVAAEIEAAGGTAAFLRTNVASADDCRRMAEEAVGRWGGIDHLVANAGVGEGAALVKTDEALWDRVMDVNLKGVFLCARACMPEIGKRRGSIVTVASLAAFVVAQGMAAYAATKGGVVQLTRVMAVEGAKYGIRANAVCPVWIDTPMVQAVLESSGHAAAARMGMEAGIPLGRLGTPDDVAGAILFLASADAAFITGVALPVDGGALCQ